MSLKLTRTVGSGSIPVWQGLGKDIQLLQGGVLLDTTTLPKDTVIPAGTPLIVNESARTATILPSGVLYANAGGTDTTYQVKKGHTLKVGDYFATGAAGGKAYAITAIDTSNADYDVITVGTTIGAATAGDLMYGSTATGATASAYPAANALLYADTVVGEQGVDEEVSAVIRGTVYARRVPYNATIAAITGLSKIIYSQSK
jgi:hypothetical protein